MKRLIEKLAANLCDNTDITEKNRAARLLSKLPDHELNKRHLCREKLALGADAYPWTLDNKTREDNDLEELVRVVSQQPEQANLRSVRINF